MDYTNEVFGDYSGVSFRLFDFYIFIKVKWLEPLMPSSMGFSGSADKEYYIKSLE